MIPASSSLPSGDHYWPHISPGFWDRFNEAIDDGTLLAVQPVKDELIRKDDEIGKWAMRTDGFFVPLDEDIQKAAINVLATHLGLITQSGKRSTVDPFVIALGMARGIPVVSYERKSNSPAKPHIPNALRVRLERYQGLVASPFSRVGRELGIQRSCPVRFWVQYAKIVL